jgi:quercetin dioxygenase-like cupin family protein
VRRAVRLGVEPAGPGRRLSAILPRVSEARFHVGHLDEIDAVLGYEAVEGEWRPVRHQLGIDSFGVNAWVADAGKLIIEEHDETSYRHEELYLVVRGRARFTLDGEDLPASAGTLVAIHDPSVVRSAVAEEDGTAILAIGVPRGEPFEVSEWEKRELDR